MNTTLTTEATGCYMLH